MAGPHNADWALREALLFTENWQVPGGSRQGAHPADPLSSRRTAEFASLANYSAQAATTEWDIDAARGATLSILRTASPFHKMSRQDDMLGDTFWQSRQQVDAMASNDAAAAARQAQALIDDAAEEIAHFKATRAAPASSSQEGPTGESTAVDDPYLDPADIVDWQVARRFIFRQW